MITNVTASSRTTGRGVSGTAVAGNVGGGKGGVGGSGLSVGALVGIIIGGIAGLALVAFLITHTIRRRARKNRTANRSSLFEPWPAPAPVSLEDEPYEKSRYDTMGAGGAGVGAGAYPMHEQSYGPYGNGQAHGYDQYGNPMGQYDPNAQYYQQQQQQGYAQYPDNGYGYDHAAAAGVAGAAGMGAAGAIAGAGSQGQESAQGQGQAVNGTGTGAGSALAAQMGLADGMMVNVKVGFVRTLEDELAITPGQQLYLHQAYDDGWSLCEDQAQNKGVVPLSCLEPWQDGLAPGGNMPRSGTSESVTADPRRSSLVNTQN